MGLRGVGGFLMTMDGKRFCNELGRRDYVTGEMWKNRGFTQGSCTGFFLCLNSKASAEITWHVKHYKEVAEKIAKDPEGGPYDAYGGGKTYDKWGKKFFHNLPVEVNDKYHVTVVTPVIHYCMGGLKIDDEARVLTSSGKVIEGLYGSGEAAGGIHGTNRLGGNSLLDCVVYGRVSGRSAARHMMAYNIKAIEAASAPAM